MDFNTVRFGIRCNISYFILLGSFGCFVYSCKASIYFSKTVVNHSMVLFVSEEIRSIEACNPIWQFFILTPDQHGEPVS